ncbi:copper resistance D family protein [Halalkalicoccus sp. NIPERK01]|uniref:copper resistance D family protein n=1 Tax=Halalkalicoccus sp. NIPERK01 TaxID=3053469 RepID=UPI00256EF447|nr:CopD family protein [Halalkalicoccus sp. NIPERK01]MDL5360637.1 CopD family protein [Halalkalicoccus sp. NIPERK01]
MSAGLMQLMELGNPAFRGVLVGALMLLIGAPPTLSFVVLPELERRGLDTTRAHQVPLPIMGVSLIGATFAGTALAIENAQTADIASFLAWTGSTSAGQAWLVFVAVAVVLGGLTTGWYVIPGNISWRLWLGTVFLGAFAMLVTFCWTRFSTAVDIPAVAILVKLGHMTGAALWVGGLAVLAVLPRLVPRDVDSDADTDMARLVLAVVRRFSIVAVTGVTVAFATGVVIAAWHVPTLTALATTPYGVLLSAKVGLVVVAATMGGFNRLVLHEQIAYSVRESTDAAVLPGLLAVVEPRITVEDAVSTITRSIRLELAVLVVAIGLSAALTTVVTPSYELLEPAVGASSGIVWGVVPIGFATLLKSGAISIGLAGSLALGYELGKFDPARE